MYNELESKYRSPFERDILLAEKRSYFSSSVILFLSSWFDCDRCLQAAKSVDVTLTFLRFSFSIALGSLNFAIVFVFLSIA